MFHTAIFDLTKKVQSLSESLVQLQKGTRFDAGVVVDNLSLRCFLFSDYISFFLCFAFLSPVVAVYCNSFPGLYANLCRLYILLTEVPEPKSLQGSVNHRAYRDPRTTELTGVPEPHSLQGSLNHRAYRGP